MIERFLGPVLTLLLSRGMTRQRSNMGYINNTGVRDAGTQSFSSIILRL